MASTLPRFEIPQDASLSAMAQLETGSIAASWDQGLEQTIQQHSELQEKLKRGVWVEFLQEDGEWSRSKLTWVSPMKSKYLFTNRQGVNALSFELNDIVQAFADGKARWPEEGALLDRAVNRMVETLKH